MPEPRATSPTRRDLLRYSLLLGAGAAAGPLLVGGEATAAPASVLEAGPVKTRSTYYTTEKIAAARANIANYGWAQTLRDTAVTASASILAQGDDWAWNQVTTQGLPRSYAVNQDLGSPVTGKDIYQYGNYPWLADIYGRPWKMVDPSVPEGSTDANGNPVPRVYPTNDFWAFYQSGLDEHGNFDRARGDQSLLVNTLYPHMGPTWGVEDGFGWIDDNGKKWTFAAYYNHWFSWYAGKSVLGAINFLRDSYVYTGDVKYAHLGLIMLDRIADVYPSMDTAPYPRAEGYFHSDGLTGKGKVIGSIWETGLARDFCSAFDAFFPAIASGDDANIVSFLNAKATQFGLPAKDSVEAIRANIENGLLRQIYPAVKEAKIRGNFGMHQSTLAMAAVVLDEPASAKEWIDFVFQPGGLVSSPVYKVTGGNVGAALINDVDRDGNGNEAAPGYNNLWLGQIKNVADILSGYDGYPAADLYEHVKFGQMFSARYAPHMLNRYLLPIGDTASTGNPVMQGTARDYTFAYERYNDTINAQMAYLFNGNKVEGLYGDIFSGNAAQTQQAIQRVIDEKGTLKLPSVNHTGYGLAALRDGTGAAMRGLWLYYGRNGGHGHLDTLNLGLHGFGVDLMPDLGYPEFADNNNRRREWTGNTVAHNTVVVDAVPQKVHVVGTPMGFAVGEKVQLVDVAAPQVYPQTSLYRRVSALIAIDDTNYYAVDVFRIIGGNQHHFSFHGAQGPVTVDGLTMVAQPTGTYAGPTVEQPPDTAPARPNASGFDWLGKVERDTNPPNQFAADWKITDTWGVHNPDPDLHLRLTMLGDTDEIALADGIPPRNKPGNPASLRYLIAKRAGTNLASQFTSVIEPYVGTRAIRSISAVSVTATNGETLAAHEVTAVKVELTNNRTDYIISSLRTDIDLLIDGQIQFRGAFGVYAHRRGAPEFAFTHGSTMLKVDDRSQEILRVMQAPAPAITGTVASFTTELSVNNQITLTLPEGIPAETVNGLAGSYVYIDNDRARNATYRIDNATQNGSTLTLNIGESTTIRSYRDNNDTSKGYIYDLAVGANARIPVTREWNRP